jgi:hypothetical protein
MAKAHPLKYYQHRYGGVYHVDKPKVLSTVDKSEWVVYTHAWPFEIETWIRPKTEWEDGRFREVFGEELLALFAKDRLEFQEEITKARAAARDK